MTLGQLLKSRRTELGKSIQQIAVSTKIHVKVLKAIEDDLYAELPARTFTRGFISAYCKALKLNPDQTLSDYHDFLESKFAERQDRDQGHHGYVFEGKELEQNRRWLILGASIAGIFAIAVLLVFKPQNHKRKEKHKDFVEESATTEGTETPEAEIGVPKPVINNNPTEPIGAGTTVTTKQALTVDTHSALGPSPAPTAAAHETKAKPPSSTATTVSTPTPSNSPVAEPSATPASSPSPIASVSPSPKDDKLNKGDDLSQSEAKRKITFQAQEDVIVRYQVDQKPVSSLILRKGRMLVIKGKEKIRVETNKPSSLKYKTKGGTYLDLAQGLFSVEAGGTLNSEANGSLGTKPIPDQVPAPSSR